MTEENKEVPKDVGIPKEKDWTIMVYMAGDNNLSENMAFSLVDIESGVNDTSLDGQMKVNVLSFFDGSSLTAPTFYTDYSRDDGESVEPHRVRRTDTVGYHNSSNTPIPYATADGSSASAYSILNFVAWCIRDRGRIAKNYALIFSGHSFGFHGTSFLKDDSSGQSITLFKFRWALEETVKNYFDFQPISILGFDSCVMSMLEVGYELREVAQSIVASEGSLPNSGWGYAPLLKNFISGLPSKTGQVDEPVSLQRTAAGGVKTIAKGFVTRFIEHHNKLLVGGRSVDMSAWDLDKVSVVVDRVNDMAIELNKHLNLAKKIQDGTFKGGRELEVYHELKKLVLQSHSDAQPFMKNQCVDLKDFCQRLILECKFIENGPYSKELERLIPIARSVILAIDACVLRCGYSGDEYQFSNGISIYFPWTYLAYSMTDYRYRYLRFNKGLGKLDEQNSHGPGRDWNLFLRNYLSRVTLRSTRKTIGNKPSVFEDFSKDNPLWSKDNPYWSKDNPYWSRDNPEWSRDNPEWSRDNPEWSRDNPEWSRDNPEWSKDQPPFAKGEGEGGTNLFYFQRYRNYQMAWDISGFTDESDIDEDFR